MKRKKRASSKELMEFMELIVKLDPIEFVGVTKILCVQIVDDEYQAREFEDILSDMIDKFISIKQKPRKDILKMLRQANKEKKENGNVTKD